MEPVLRCSSFVFCLHIQKCAPLFSHSHTLPRCLSLSLSHSAFSISNFPNIIICRVAFCFAASLLMLLRKDAFVYNNDKQLDFPRSSNAILIIYLVVTTHFRPENLEHPFYTPIQNIHRISTLNVYTFFLSFCCCWLNDEVLRRFNNAIFV